MKRYRLQPVHLGVLPGIDLDHALRVADELEDLGLCEELERGRLKPDVGRRRPQDTGTAGSTRS